MRALIRALAPDATAGMLAGSIGHELSNALTSLQLLADQLAQLQNEATRYTSFQTGFLERLGGEEAVKAAQETLAAAEVRPPAPAIARVLDGCHKNIAQLDHVVRQVRGLSGWHTGPGSQRVELAALVQRAIDLAGVELQHRADLEVALGPPAVVAGREHSLVQALAALLLNAVRNLDDSERQRPQRVRVSSRHSEVGIELRISETVRNIEPSLGGRPVDWSDWRLLGPGAALCVELVEEAGGRLHLERSELGGTTLVMRLREWTEDADPFAVMSQSDVTGVSLTPAAEPAAPPPRPESHRPRVLLVEDDDNVRLACGFGLRNHFEVTAVGSGNDAIAKVEGARDGERAFDVVVCDLMLDGMTGADVFRRLEGVAPRLARKFLVVTGGATTPGLRRFLDESGVPVLNKPYELRELRARIREIAGEE